MSNDKNSIPEMLNDNVLNFLVEETIKFNKLSEEKRKVIEGLIKYMGMGFLGMARHPYPKADWTAHNSLFTNNANELSKVIDPEISGGAESHTVGLLEEHYWDLGIRPNA